VVLRGPLQTAILLGALLRRLQRGGLPGNNAVAYWGVPDAHVAYARLVGLGAREKSAIREVGGGILVGTVVDPFGNILGIIQNPHFKRG